MKKISFILLLFLLILTSCKSNKINTYDESNIDEFSNSLYQDINTEGSKYACFDLRSNDEYVKLHLKQFQNYDLSNYDLESFVEHLRNNYSKKYIIYLYSDIDIDVSIIKDYNIKLCKMSFDKFNEKLKDDFIFDSGDYDCGC